jgi:hypothetical protein
MVPNQDATAQTFLGFGEPFSTFRRRTDPSSEVIQMSTAWSRARRFKLSAERGAKGNSWQTCVVGPLRTKSQADGSGASRGKDHSSRVDFTVVKSWEAEKGFSRNR